MKRNNFVQYLFLLIILFAFFSCDKNQVYEKNIEIPGLSWNKDSVIRFSVDIQDTLSPHNIFVNVRNTSQYAMQNLFLFIKNQ